LVQCLIERELRLAMQRHDIKQLALYPEQRQCKKPTTELVLRLLRNKTPGSGFQTVVATGLMTKPRSLARRLSAATLR
jgi:hypothetical protein